MSRKEKQKKGKFVPDPKFNSTVMSKFINNVMLMVKKELLKKMFMMLSIKSEKLKIKDEPIRFFKNAINNIKPTVEVRSRRVGGATYQVPVEIEMRKSPSFSN